MNETVSPVAADDAAWAAVNTPLNVEQLTAFCQDVQRLFRINPMLEFSTWKEDDENHFHFTGKNISQEQSFEFDLRLEVERRPDEIIIHYQGGIKTRTVFKIEASEFGSKLTIIEFYEGLSEDERQDRINEVDRSLVNWADYLQRYLIMWQRWSCHGWWRWYMRRVWQPMKPSARRITYMFWWITLVEIALIMLGAAIYWNEYA